MNSTSSSTSEISKYIKEQNELEFVNAIPTVLVLSVLMPIGVVGNALVIYVYGFCMRKNASQYFITLLALADFFCDLVVIPLEIYHLRRPLIYPYENVCKISAFLYYFSSVYTILILLAIAIERYRKICRPTKPPFSKKSIRIFTLALTVISFIISIPVLILFSRVPKRVPGRKDLVGYRCDMNHVANESPYHPIILTFVTVVLLLIAILYSLIWRTVHRHFMNINRVGYIRTVACVLHTSSKKKLMLTTRTVVLVTALSLLSHLPHYAEEVALMARNQSETEERKRKTIVITILHSVYWSCCLNPFVYAFFAQKFRYIVFKKFFRRKQRLTSNEYTRAINTTANTMVSSN